MSLLFHLGLTLLVLSTGYRLLWRRRHHGAAGLVCRPAHITRVTHECVELAWDGGRCTHEATGLRTGDRVVLEGIEVGGMLQPVRLRRGVWPELTWLRWARAAAVAVMAVALTVQAVAADEPPAGLSRQVAVDRTVRAGAVPARPRAPDPATLARLQRRLAPLQRALGKPGPGDWRAVHHEPRQSLQGYIRSAPEHARGRRRVLFLQPIGTFAGRQQQVLELTADFMSRYLCLETRIARPIPLSLVPASARRRHPTWGGRQILTGYVLRHLLAPRLPGDAAAYIGFTTADLWPGRGWNFVFGQASLRERVGVWSLHRMGDPERDLNRCLLRTIKTAVHETGHMLSMHHCTAQRCNMNGSNSLAESDRGPIALCSECLAKLVWATGCDPVRRYRGLIDFFVAHKMEPQERRYRRLLAALQR